MRVAHDDLGAGPAVLRGMGRSDAPERGYGMSVYADDLASLLDALGVERTVVCGLSMGGYVALEFLHRHRERVRAGG